MRRSPLPKRRTPIKRTRLKVNRSKSIAVVKDTYEALLFRDQGCRGRAYIPEVACRGRLDPHHILPRSHGGQDTLGNMIVLCRAHHDWVHQHPLLAGGFGLLKRSGQ